MVDGALGGARDIIQHDAAGIQTVRSEDRSHSKDFRDNGTAGYVDLLWFGLVEHLLWTCLYI